MQCIEFKPGTDSFAGINFSSVSTQYETYLSTFYDDPHIDTAAKGIKIWLQYMGYWITISSS